MNSLKGHLLVATPQLLEPNFFRTVLLIFEHNEEGAAGIVLNRPTDATITDIAQQILNEDFKWDKAINLGGPVSGPLMVLHTNESLGDMPILPGIFSTADAAKLEQILRQMAEPSLIIANYAGWGPGQLENEIAEDSWFSLPARPEHVFWTADADDLWDTVVKEIQSASLPHILGLRHLPDDPSVN